MDALGTTGADAAGNTPEIRRAPFRRRSNFALLRRRGLRKSSARSRQTTRISRRHPAVSENHRAIIEAQGIESGLYQTARFHDQDGETLECGVRVSIVPIVSVVPVAPGREIVDSKPNSLNDWNLWNSCAAATGTF